ncbi:MAG: DUF3794 domain-containing protein [Firmicutes bacterium]|nr:DUF3794 domain-containing protein [Bacillota bacterium]
MTEYKDEQYNLEEIPEFALMPAREPEEEECIAAAAEEFSIPEVSLPQKAVKPPFLSSAKDLLEEEEVSFVSLVPGQPVCFWVEEDVLVPDSKPDVGEILSVQAQSCLDGPDVYTGKDGLRFLKVGGSLTLRILYGAMGASGVQSLTAMRTGIPFREDAEVNAPPESELSVTSEIQSLECSAVNERKLRIRAQICLSLCQYRSRQVSLLRGAKDPAIQCRKDVAVMTDILSRRRERFEVREVLDLREGMSEIGDILAYDVWLGTPSSQADPEKVVVNVPVHYRIFYRRAEDIFSEIEGEETGLLQGQTEFTQFLSPGGERGSGTISGCHIRCCIKTLNLEPGLDPSGRQSQFILSMETETSADFYGGREEEFVTDLYHMEKETLFDGDSGEASRILGSVQGECAVREVLSLPGDGSADVLWISGQPHLRSLTAESGKVIGEGDVLVHLVYRSSDAGEFSASEHSLPFRCSVPFAAAENDVDVIGEAILKDLWFDRINGQQLELNAGVGIRGLLLEEQSLPLLRNVSLADVPEGEDRSPSIAVYFAKEGDDLWSVAKKYRSSADRIGAINHLSPGETFAKGDKVLIVN